MIYIEKYNNYEIKFDKPQEAMLFIAYLKQTKYPEGSLYKYLTPIEELDKIGIPKLTIADKPYLREIVAKFLILTGLQHSPSFTLTVNDMNFSPSIPNLGATIPAYLMKFMEERRKHHRLPFVIDTKTLKKELTPPGERYAMDVAIAKAWYKKFASRFSQQADAIFGKDGALKDRNVVCELLLKREANHGASEQTLIKIRNHEASIPPCVYAFDVNKARQSYNSHRRTFCGLGFFNRKSIPDAIFGTVDNPKTAEEVWVNLHRRRPHGGASWHTIEQIISTLCQADSSLPQHRR